MFAKNMKQVAEYIPPLHISFIYSRMHWVWLFFFFSGHVLGAEDLEINKP